MAAVEARDGDDVHEGQDEGQQCGEVPESLPVPVVGEEAGHGTEAAEVLRAAGGEEHLQSRHVGHQRLPAVADAGRDGLEQCVVDVAHIGEEARDVGLALHAQLAGTVHLHLQRGRDAVSVEAHDNRLALVSGQRGGNLVEGRHVDSVDGHQAVARQHASLLGGGTCHERLDHEGDAGRHKLFDALIVDALHQAAAHGHIDQRVAAAHADLPGVAEQEHLVGLHVVVHLLPVDGADEVAVLEALVEHHLMVLETEGGAVHGQLVLAPVGEDGAVEQQGGDEVDQHAAADDAETLPCGFGTVLPRLGLLLEVALVLGLVNHAGNVAVAAQRYPAQAPEGVVLVLGSQVLFVPAVGGLGVEPKEVPLAAELLGLQDGELPIEEYIVPTHARVEQFGKKEVAQLVGGHQDGETEDKG